jgi:hypothetical protein
MRKIARLRIAILALMLVVSHIALMSHVTVHFSPDLEKCELCVSQAQMSAAIPASDQSFQDDTVFGDLEIHSSRCVVYARFPKTCHQRAPPFLSA